ncbi:hypothetical protein FFWV33_01530 [Flavobacterium faecale]|uniref:MOSC domain-containing protein n=1 Tax=Flavobacterium faecale TaxID=1355330 RepID=A0A2S1L988_9FLAO|nr:MOSC N-terminal beta barrel domain-containing protein [Flavobacterium faecale]AWG20297.1 hypothetical protein FFWV33_01530 [Flavobacterium faecale]
MLQLSQIWIYPIKSLAGISLQQSQVTSRGLEFDRRWMLVDDAGVFVTQRNFPEMVLFKTAIKDGFLEVSHPSTASNVTISLSNTKKGPAISSMVWEDEVQAIVEDENIAKWFSAILRFSVRLVYMPDESHRKVDPRYAIESDNITSLSDGYPFLIIGQSSLDDLNSRLKEPVSIQRFRPNFVFQGGVAYEEEGWKNFTIGNQQFQGVKPCGRCVMISVDPEKGIVSGKEPLATLSKYKMEGNNVIFGQNLIAKDSGLVTVGEKIMFE